MGSCRARVIRFLSSIVAADEANGVVRGKRGNAEGIITVRMRPDGRVGVEITSSDPDRTEFEQFSGGAQVVDGVATLEGVRAAIRFAEATAKGRIDLGKGTLKVTAQAKVNEAPDFGPGENLKDLKGVTLPVVISGPFAKPKVEVDMVKAAASLLKPDMLKEEKLRKKLKGLFG